MVGGGNGDGVWWLWSARFEAPAMASGAFLGAAGCSAGVGAMMVAAGGWLKKHAMKMEELQKATMEHMQMEKEQLKKTEALHETVLEFLEYIQDSGAQCALKLTYMEKRQMMQFASGG